MKILVFGIFVAVLLRIGCAFGSENPTVIASAHSARFDKAFIACDVPALLELYEDGATAIFEEQFSQGKAEIEKMVKSYCADGQQMTGPYKQTTAHARWFGSNWIMMVRTLEGVDDKGKTFRINATELMHKTKGQWRYVVDHASYGESPIPATGESKSAQ